MFDVSLLFTDESFVVQLWRPILLAGSILLGLVPLVVTVVTISYRRKIKPFLYISVPRQPPLPVQSRQEAIAMTVNERVEDRRFVYNACKFEIEDESLLKIDLKDKTKKLGDGEYGVVLVGEYRGKKAAVKIPKEKRDDEQWFRLYKREMLHVEITVLSNVDPPHPNILRLEAAMTDGWQKGGRLLMVMELCDGNVLQLMAKRKFVNQLDYISEPGPTGYSAMKGVYQFEKGKPVPAITKDEVLTTSDLISIGQQAANGMAYLSSIQCFHRDLAARNLLVKVVDDLLIVKVSDFGLSRKREQGYYRASKFAQPIDWTSPEVHVHNKFTAESDIWSFGITLFELFTLGRTPYAGMERGEVESWLMSKQERLIIDKPPDLCQHELFNLIADSLYFEPTRRPPFQKCAEILDTHLERANPEKRRLLQRILNN